MIKPEIGVVGVSPALWYFRSSEHIFDSTQAPVINVKVLGLSLIIDTIIKTRSSLLLVISNTRPTVKDN